MAALVNGSAVPSLYATQKRTTSYGFAEISLPLIAPENDIPFVNRLTLTGAVRYEDIGNVGDVATPKLGAIYAPVKDLTLKTSWGKTFKAPTDYQSIRPKNGYSQVGSTAFFPPSPTPGTVLYLSGGNLDLKPEKATNLTIPALSRRLSSKDCASTQATITLATATVWCRRYRRTRSPSHRSTVRM